MFFGFFWLLDVCRHLFSGNNISLGILLITSILVTIVKFFANIKMLTLMSAVNFLAIYIVYSEIFSHLIEYAASRVLVKN